MIRRALPRTSPALSRAFSKCLAHRREVLPTTNSPIVSKLGFFNSVSGDAKQIPTFRLLDGVGKPLDDAVLPEVG